MNKEFSLGEIATIISGRSFSQKDPMAKELIGWISGEPASEFTWLAPHPNRVDHCREWLIASVGTVVLSQTQQCVKDIIDGLHSGSDEWLELENEMISVPKPSYFPEPNAD